MKKLKHAVWCHAVLDAAAQRGRRAAAHVGARGAYRSGAFTHGLTRNGAIASVAKSHKFMLAARALVPWMLLLSGARRRVGGLSIGSDSRAHLADWVFAEFFASPMDFNIVLHVLGGDEYYERNKRDVAKLERETGRNVMSLWDTDPIFVKYPHLRGLARNAEFEKKWVETRQKVKL